jgi:hypothetical protein
MIALPEADFEFYEGIFVWFFSISKVLSLPSILGTTCFDR